jgi:hypothetical protein
MIGYVRQHCEPQNQGHWVNNSVATKHCYHAVQRICTACANPAMKYPQASVSLLMALCQLSDSGRAC